MGLVLSGQGEKGSPLLTLARRYSQYLSYPLLLVGLLWLLALPLDNMARRVYISENALMPGQADTEFGSTSHIQAMSLIDSALLAHEHVKDPSERQAQAVGSVFEGLGLDTQIHRFNYDEVQGVGDHRGINVHGILRAPRSDGVEALLLAASWRTSDNYTNLNAVRLMAGMAKYAQEQVYWAKDIILVVTDAGEIGIEKWLRAYHGQEPGLHVRSGIIQAAVSLDLPPAKKYNGLGLHFEGKTGQLPNLDFINTVQKISLIERMPAYLHGQEDVESEGWWDGYVRAARLLLGQISAQAVGSSVGVHAPFLRYRIDALTLSGITDERNRIDESAGTPGMPYAW
ncbi:Glycosyl phosphatidyl inositol protein transamidase complex subunit, partial [Linderina macrospora]